MKRERELITFITTTLMILDKPSYSLTDISRFWVGVEGLPKEAYNRIIEEVLYLTYVDKVYIKR